MNQYRLYYVLEGKKNLLYSDTLKDLKKLIQDKSIFIYHLSKLINLNTNHEKFLLIEDHGFKDFINKQSGVI